MFDWNLDTKLEHSLEDGYVDFDLVQEKNAVTFTGSN